MVVVIVTFAAALIAGFIFTAVGVIAAPVPTMVAGAAILALLITPPIYAFVLWPLAREYGRRRAVERVADDMNRLAVTDTLTRLMNRRGITMSLLDAMAQAERYGAPLVVAMVDIDHFQRINDGHGREAGDKVLTDVAALLAEALRMPDKVGRYGDEEFLALMPHTTLAQAHKIAERVRTSVAKWDFTVAGTTQRLSVSLGLAEFRKGEDLEALLSRVDEALKAAKSGGRNRIATAKSA